MQLWWWHKGEMPSRSFTKTNRERDEFMAVAHIRVFRHTGLLCSKAQQRLGFFSTTSDDMICHIRHIHPYTIVNWYGWIWWSDMNRHHVVFLDFSSCKKTLIHVQVGCVCKSLFVDLEATIGSCPWRWSVIKQAHEMNGYLIRLQTDLSFRNDFSGKCSSEVHWFLLAFFFANGLKVKWRDVTTVVDSTNFMSLHDINGNSEYKNII